MPPAIRVVECDYALIGGAKPQLKVYLFHGWNPETMLDAMKPVRIPIQDVIDLHTFRPQDFAPLIADYIDACVHAGFCSVRIIHGKGRGIQKQRVRELLRCNPHVVSLHDAPAEAGGWGATIVALSRKGAP